MRYPESGLLLSSSRPPSSNRRLRAPFASRRFNQSVSSQVGAQKIELTWTIRSPAIHRTSPEWRSTLIEAREQDFLNKQLNRGGDGNGEECSHNAKHCAADKYGEQCAHRRHIKHAANYFGNQQIVLS